jgi:hypothetical protein
MTGDTKHLMEQNTGTREAERIAARPWNLEAGVSQ